MNPPERSQTKPTEAQAPIALRGGPDFDFHRDTFAYANETKWVYSVDPITGRQVSTPRVPEPSYALHCFAMARTARQFWWHARFDPSLAAPDEATCRRLIREVVSGKSPARSVRNIVIPGYTGLREFSATWEALLKRECGGAWQSYFQRGNWRMIFPFTRAHQQSEADRLLSILEQGGLPVVHVLRFPQLTINHTVLLFSVRSNPNTIEFRAYDPNIPEREVGLCFDRATRTFTWPALPYFAGGRVDVYEIYRGWIY
ncbi:MAG: hypothetical protein EBS05_06975 [Proteobacteria bacterium]|nr:hypothetical protein [Pseudomonadota bacterium]